jgi:hypothetical protein
MYDARTVEQAREENETQKASVHHNLTVIGQRYKLWQISSRRLCRNADQAETVI